MNKNVQKTNSRTLHDIPGKCARITYETDYALHLHTTTTCTCTRNATYKCTLQKHPAVQYTMIKPAQLTIPGGGLPAQYTQYLHTLTTSGERRMWSSRVNGRAPVGWASSRESTYVCRASSRETSYEMGHLHEKRRTCLQGTRVPTYVSRGTFARVDE